MEFKGSNQVGCLWRVGNGEKICVWRDPWTADDGRFIESSLLQGITLVKDLIDEEAMDWDTNLIEQHFNERDIKSILAIPLSSMNI